MKGSTNAQHSMAPARSKAKRKSNGSSNDEVSSRVSRRLAGVRRTGVVTDQHPNRTINDINDVSNGQRRTASPSGREMQSYSEYLFGPDEVKNDFIKNPLWSLGEILTMATFVLGLLSIGFMVGRLS